MTHKHQLFFNGMYIVVWGHTSRAKTYQLFFKYIAELLNFDVTEVSYALQCTDMWNNAVNDIRAYHYTQIIQNFASQYGKDIHLKCDTFLQPLPEPSLPVQSARDIVKAPPANKGALLLNQLTETVVSKRRSRLDGTISRWYVLRWKNQLLSHISKLWQQKLSLSVPTITFLLVMTALFGCLVAPIS